MWHVHVFTHNFLLPEAAVFSPGVRRAGRKETRRKLDEASAC